jgi:hypothetical protein
MAFDIVKQDFSKTSEVGYTFDLILPTGENSGAKLTVIGELSGTVRAFARRSLKEFQQRQQIAKRNLLQKS